MKEVLAGVVGLIVTMALMVLIIQYATEGYPFSHKAQHKEGEYFEYWMKGNEFEPTRLFEVGQVLKVGKQNYLMGFYYCNLIIKGQEQSEVKDIKYLDKDDSYRFVNIEQLNKDAKEQCSKQ